MKELAQCPRCGRLFYKILGTGIYHCMACYRGGPRLVEIPKAEPEVEIKRPLKVGQRKVKFIKL